MALASGGISGGVVGLTGAWTRLRASTDVMVDIGEDAELLVDNGTITGEALSAVDTGNPLTLAGVVVSSRVLQGSPRCMPTAG